MCSPASCKCIWKNHQASDPKSVTGPTFHRVSMEGRSGRAHGRQGHVLVFPTSSGGSWALLVDACREAKPVQDTYNLHQLSPRSNCLLHWQNQDPHGSQLPTQNFFLYRSPSRAHVHLVAVVHLSDGWVLLLFLRHLAEKHPTEIHQYKLMNYRWSAETP